MRGTPARTLVQDDESTKTASYLPKYSSGGNWGSKYFNTLAIPRFESDAPNDHLYFSQKRDLERSHSGLGNGQSPFIFPLFAHTQKI